MHMRAFQAQGTQVIDDSTQQTLGVISDPLIDPDTGRIVGFFVLPLMIGEGELFLQSTDIASWGTRIHVLSVDRLGPPEDYVRLQKHLQDPRTFLGQKIRTKPGGRSLGTLDDVQFNTRTFAVEWLFPRKLFFIRQPIPVTEVLEVTEEAIWVRDPIRPVKEVIMEEKSQGIADPILPEVLPQAQS